MVGGSGRGELEHLLFVLLFAPLLEERRERVERQVATADQPFDAPMSSRWRESLFGPGVEAPVDDVGEVALEGSASLAFRLSLGHLALEEGARSRVDAGLGDGDSVEAGVDLPVAAAVETMAAGGGARAAGDWSRAAVAGVGGVAPEAAHVA